MIGLIQRVSSASVNINEQIHTNIKSGILLFLGVEKHDTVTECDKLLNKILHYRIFPDEKGKMNLSLIDTNKELLIISQFTLAADTNSGKRPSFSHAKPPKEARILYEYFNTQATKQVITKTGIFGADMSIHLVNDGPVTFYLTT